MMRPSSQALLALMRDYAAEAEAILAPAPPARIIPVQPGSSATWDGCKDGQLWVRLQDLTPTPTATPSRRNGADLCSVPEWIATFQLGIIRCAATMDSRGNPPSAAAITADGEEGIDDMFALLTMLADHPRTRSVTSWTPTGPEGGYHGGYWIFTVAVPNTLAQESA